MENPQASPETRIGLFLPDLEGGSDVVRVVQQAGYTTLAVLDGHGTDASGLQGCDLLILSQAQWQLLSKSIEETRIKCSPFLVVVLCPAPFDLSSFIPEELDENTTLLPYPLDAAMFVFQLKALLQRHRTNRDIRHRLKEREDVLQSISEVFFSVDHEFRYTFFNEQAQKVGGKTYREVIGKNMWEMFPKLKDSDFYHQFLETAQKREIFISEYLGPITGGWFEMRLYPSAGGLSALFVDISARKKAEANLKQAQEQLTEANSNLEKAVAERTAQLHEANQRLEELLYSIAHDLRSPLRSMQGFAQAFVDDYAVALDDRAREYGQKMTAAAIFMDRMLKDLLELGRITKTEIQLEPVDVAEVWKSALFQHEEKIKSSHAVIHTSPDLGQMTANPTLLLQILANLLGNALKFVRKDVPAEIKIWAEQLDDRNLGLYVQDNGIGIEERYHEKIFRVFERLNGSNYEGTGIGLAIARKAAERMKGRLDFTSHPGVGTKFQLILPGTR